MNLPHGILQPTPPCRVYKKIKNTIHLGKRWLALMEEYIEKSIVDDTAELLTERGLTPWLLLKI